MPRVPLAMAMILRIYKLILSIMFRLYGDLRDYNFDEIIREITYFKGTSYYINEFCMTGQYVCPVGNFKELAVSVSLILT